MSAPAAANVGHHNHVLEKAMGRAFALEPKMARVLKPILDRAGQDAAKRFRRLATDHLTAAAWLSPGTLGYMAASGATGATLSASLALRAAGPGVQSNSTMIAVQPRTEERELLGQDGGLDADTIHVTLAYLGEIDGPLDHVRDALLRVGADHAPLEGAVGGIGRFAGDEEQFPRIYLPSVPGLVELRVAATAALAGAGVDYARGHGYLPHMTVAYQAHDADKGTPEEEQIGAPLHFDELLVVRGDVVEFRLPLVGVKPVTAAGTPPWGPPAGDELIDVDRLVSTLRGKTDPVRQAVVETTMKSTLNGVGLDFDVTNPFTAKVLSHAGEQITEVAATTRENVTKIITRSYEEGLSIPDTATAIRSGMEAANVARSTLIARTELVGAANGGSLAATQIVDEVLGGGAFMKQWLTASGATTPRHELYDGLNGQETTLEGYFQVGADQLQYPGDPAGDPSEVCNCRCTIIYTESGAQVAEGDAESGGFTADDLSAEMEADAGDGGGDIGLGAVEAIMPPVGDLGVPDIAGAAGPVTTVADLTPVEVREVKNFQLGANFPLNESLREDFEVTDADYQTMKHVDAAMAKSTLNADTVVWRGVDLPAEQFLGGPPKVGMRITDKGYTSASLDKTVADRFMTTNGMEVGGTRLKINAPAGAHALEVGRATGNGLEQSEVAFPRDTTFEVRGVLADGTIELDIVTPERLAGDVAGGKTISERSAKWESGNDAEKVKRTETAKTQRVVKERVVEDDPYVQSIRDEAYTTNNVLSYMRRKVRDGTATESDLGRMEALKKRQADLRELLTTPDLKAEKARVQNQINYMNRKVKEGTASHETTHRLKILQARKETLAGLSGTARRIEKVTVDKLEVQEKVVVEEKRVSRTAEESAIIDARMDRIAADRAALDARRAEKAKELAKVLDPTSTTSLAIHIDKSPTGFVELPPHNSYSAGGLFDPYPVGPSVAWMQDGVVVKAEIREGYTAETEYQLGRGAKLNNMIHNTPPEMQDRLRSVDLFNGNSPADAYWRKAYKGFDSCAAQGGNGSIVFWHGEMTVTQNTFDHEMGHIVGDRGGPINEDPWRRAQQSDSSTSRAYHPVRVTWDNTDGKTVTLGTSAVTQYGGSAVAEDWAESVRLYLLDRRQGQLGMNWRLGRVGDGPGEPVTFRDLFPRRASLIEKWLGFEKPKSVRASVFASRLVARPGRGSKLDS